MVIVNWQLTDRGGGEEGVVTVDCGDWQGGFHM